MTAIITITFLGVKKYIYVSLIYFLYFLIQNLKK